MRRSWRRVRGAGGAAIAIETTRWGESPRPLIVATHATGFCKEVLRPFVDELMALLHSGQVAAFDHRGHGDSETTAPPFDWWDLGRDVLAVAGHLSGDQVGIVGVGHSAGGAAMLLAELLAPGTFAAMVLAEPIVFPGPYGRLEDLSLVDAAMKRKASFESPAAARANFVDKRAFVGWTPAALDEYVRGGLRRSGDVWTLTCPPPVEAEFYKTASVHAAWERLEEITVPVTLVAGERSDTHGADFMDALASRLGSDDVVIDIVPGASHFVVMEHPEVIAAHTAERLPVGSGQPSGRR